MVITFSSWLLYKEYCTLTPSLTVATATIPHGEKMYILTKRRKQFVHISELALKLQVSHLVLRERIRRDDVYFTTT